MSVSRSPDSAADEVIACRDVYKQFYLYQHRTTSAREWFIRTIRRQPITLGRAEFMLRAFNLNVARGEVVAMIGENGSGKSTALRLIAGIYVPTSGTVETRGRLAAVVELGAGFSAELTGLENVELYGAIMGLSRAQLAAHRDDILAFADIGDFINTPVKYYSSGMVARLAFSVAVCVQPDILLLDEVLAVGDHSFQKKCIERLLHFKATGGTMVVVSHDSALLSKLCSRAVWLENGTIRMEGAIDTVLTAYRDAPSRPARNTAGQRDA